MKWNVLGVTILWYYALNLIDSVTSARNAVFVLLWALDSVATFIVHLEIWWNGKRLELSLTDIWYQLFVEGLKSPVTMAPSSSALSKYLHCTKIKNPDELLSYRDSPKFIQNQFIDYMINLKIYPLHQDRLREVDTPQHEVLWSTWRYQKKDLEISVKIALQANMRNMYGSLDYWMWKYFLNELWNFGAPSLSKVFGLFPSI